jgi:trehalose 6-phosphate phosphatase
VTVARNGATGAALGARLADRDGLLVATDFDGTLAPIAADPAVPTATPAARAALATLADRPDVHVAVVSGRALADLRHRVGLPDVTYVGNHGLELAVDGAVTVHPEAERVRPTMQRLARALARRFRAVPGARLEDKGVTLTAHVREVAPDDRQPVVDAVAAAANAASHPLRVVPGKASLELRPRIDWDKGAAVGAIAARLPPTWSTVYLGDDTTDEDVFRTLGPTDAGVFVGTGRTAAGYRVTGQSDVPAFLDWLVTLRERPVRDALTTSRPGRSSPGR